jgi:predicted Co/Zn/Cd cation transporter (cation efflux family)
VTVATDAVPDNEFASERRLLGWSIACGLLLAGLGIAVGITARSQIILFDGFYTFLGIGLSYMALRVSRLVAAGPTSRYPFGREALTPLIIGFEAVALLATCAYAAFTAVITILEGGSRPPGGWAIAYAAFSFVIPVLLGWALKRDRSGSELVAAEAIQWLSGAVLGLGMLVAFVFARIIQGTSWSAAARYVDPVLVLIATALFVLPPLRMIRSTFIELVEGTPDQDLQEPVREAVDSVRAKFALGEHHLRMTKVGRKFYVEIDFLVSPEWCVRESDLVRHALAERLEALPHDLWLTLEFTADATWGA